MQVKGAHNATSLSTISQELTVLVFQVEETEISPSVPGENFTISCSPEHASNLKFVMYYLQIVKYIIKYSELRTFALLSTEFDTWVNCLFRKIQDSHFHKTHNLHESSTSTTKKLRYAFPFVFHKFFLEILIKYHRFLHPYTSRDKRVESAF